MWKDAKEAPSVAGTGSDKEPKVGLVTRDCDHAVGSPAGAGPRRRPLLSDRHACPPVPLPLSHTHTHTQRWSQLNSGPPRGPRTKVETSTEQGRFLLGKAAT